MWQRMRDMRPSRTSGFFLFDFLPDEVHEVMTLASDAPGSLFGELEKITRDSEHHSYLAHELLLFYGVTVASFLAPCLDQGLATVSLFSVVLRFVVHFLVRPFTTPSRVHVSTEPQA